MPLQLRRGLNADRVGTTFAEGEPIWTTDTNVLYVGDGVTPGGIEVAGGGGGGGVTEIIAGSNITVNTSTGAVTISGQPGGVTSIIAGTNIDVSTSTGAVTISLQSTSTYQNLEVIDTLTAGEQLSFGTGTYRLVWGQTSPGSDNQFFINGTGGSNVRLFYDQLDFVQFNNPTQHYAESRFYSTATFNNTITVQSLTVGLNTGTNARDFGYGAMPFNANNMKIELPNNGSSLFFAFKNPSGVARNVGFSRQGNIVLQQGSISNGFPSGVLLQATDGGQAFVGVSTTTNGVVYSSRLGANTSTGVFQTVQTNAGVNFSTLLDYTGKFTVPRDLAVTTTATVATLKFGDGTTMTTAPVNEADQSLNTTSDVTFNSVTISTTATANELSVTTTATVGAVKFENGSEITTSTGGFGSAIKITPAGGTSATQALLIYPTAVDGDHLHLTAGGDQTELYLGNDSQYVKLASSGTVEIRSYSILGTSTNYVFGYDGVFEAPALAVNTATVNELSVTTSASAASLSVTNTATVNEVVVGPDLRAIKSIGYNTIGVEGNWHVGNVLEVGTDDGQGFITSTGNNSLTLQTSGNNGPGGSIVVGYGDGAGVALYSGNSQEFATALFNTTTNTINYGLTVNGTLAASTVTANSVVTQDLVSSGGFPLDGNGQALIRVSSTQTPAMVVSNYTAGLLPEVVIRGYGQNRPGGPTSTTPGAAGVVVESSRGTHTAPTVPGVGDVIASFSGGSYDGTRWSSDMNIYPAQIIATAAETWAGNATTTTNAGSRLEMWVQPPAVQLNTTSRFRPMRHVWTAGNVGTGTPPILNIHEGSGQDGAPTLTPASGTGSFGTGSGRVNLVKTHTFQQIFGVPTEDTAADNPSLKGTNSISFISGRRSGVAGRRNKLLVDDTIGSLTFAGQTTDNSTGIGAGAAAITVTAADNFGAAAAGGTMKFATTVIGTNAGSTNRLVLNSSNNSYISGVHDFLNNSATPIASLNTSTAQFFVPVTFPVYTVATKPASGSVGQQICISDSGGGGGNVNGMMAFWDTTNSRWSYVHDNNAV